MSSASRATATGFGRFFLPGPTEVLPEILAAQTRPMIGHRGKSMEQLIAGMMPGLQRIFRTSRPVYISASSATGLMEAAVRNCGGQRILALVNGAFSDRFFKIAQANGFPADALEVPMGQVHLPELVQGALRRVRYDAITVVHSETSTGVRSCRKRLVAPNSNRRSVASMQTKKRFLDASAKRSTLKTGW